MSETAGEKTFAPTDKRKKDAALKGDVLRSRDLSTAAAAMAGAAWLQFAGPWCFNVLAGGLQGGLTFGHATIDGFSPGRLMMAALLAVLPPVLVLGGMVLFASITSQLGFGEGRWLPGNLAPKASRINPANGLKRMFGMQGLVELGKGLLKATLMGIIAWVWAGKHLGLITAMQAAGLGAQVTMVWQSLTSLLFALSAGLVLIALIDFPIQWVRRFMRLRMSNQDLRDENKETEGSPEKKQAIRQRQRQLARGGMHRAMREAQFVITNPTHFSIALAYDPAKASAPVVLAKGRGEKALAMRDLAVVSADRDLRPFVLK